jgi:ubiquinol-cytochrome c reductase cytochrome b subunit
VRECAACHDEGKDRKAPLIGAGWNDRAWIRGLLLDPSHDAYFGRTEMVKAEDAMPKTVAPAANVDALVEMIYAESGAGDADPAKVARGRELFDSDDDDGDGEDDEGSCTGCHERKGTEASSGPNLAGRGSAEYLADFIRNPAEPRFFGVRDEMKGFGRDRLSNEDLWALVDYLIWLRTASPADVAKLAEDG